MQTIKKFMIYMLEHKKKKEKKLCYVVFPMWLRLNKFP